MAQSPANQRSRLYLVAVEAEDRQPFVRVLADPDRPGNTVQIKTTPSQLFGIPAF